MYTLGGFPEYGDLSVGILPVVWITHNIEFEAKLRNNQGFHNSFTALNGNY